MSTTNEDIGTRISECREAADACRAELADLLGSEELADHVIEHGCLGDHDEWMLARPHEDIGTKISAYRKVAAAARAELDALLAVRDLEELRGDRGLSGRF